MPSTAKVVSRAKDADGRIKGTYNPNPILDTRISDVSNTSIRLSFRIRRRVGATVGEGACGVKEWVKDLNITSFFSMYNINSARFKSPQYGLSIAERITGIRPVSMLLCRLVKKHGPEGQSVGNFPKNLSKVETMFGDSLG